MINSVYLAARWGRQSELREARKLLADAGIGVTSSWLDVVSRNNGAGEDDEERMRAALLDVRDVTRADAFVAFSEPPENTHGRGGRHVEFGLARGLGKPIIVVGPRENVFHWLPGVIHVTNVGELLKALGS